jgi:hypothetical protein
MRPVRLTHCFDPIKDLRWIPRYRASWLHAANLEFCFGRQVSRKLHPVKWPADPGRIVGHSYKAPGSVQGSCGMRNPISLSPQAWTFSRSTSSQSCLLDLKEGNSFWWHFNSGSTFWIPSDAPSSLARVKAAESADFDLVPGPQGTDDAVKYGANDQFGFLPGYPNGLVHLFRQIGSCRSCVG